LSKYPMKLDFPEQTTAGYRRSPAILALAALLAAACAQTPATEPAPAPPASSGPRVEIPEAVPLLTYYQSLARMNAAELTKERNLLAALPAGPAKQIRQAMVIGHPRGQSDSARALALVEQTLRSNEPNAVELHPLAQLLADHYGERMRLDNERLRQEGALERQGQLLKESQRKTQELQEKLKGLADIERSLSPRPGAPGGQR